MPSKQKEYRVGYIIVSQYPQENTKENTKTPFY